VFGTTRLDSTDPQLAFPARLVGGRGTTPVLFYLAANRDARFGGFSLFRSDDDGRTWTEVLAYRAGGTTDRPEASNVRLGGLTYDAARPDRVYVGLNEDLVNASGGTLTDGRVRMSASGGTSWIDLGRRSLWKIADLSLGVDCQSLCLATEQGVWRLRLDRIQPSRPPAQVPGTPGAGTARP